MVTASLDGVEYCASHHYRTLREVVGIEWAQGGPAKHHGRGKHIDIRYNYVMKEAKLNNIELKKV